MQDTVYHLNIPHSLALVADLHERPYGKVLSSLSAHQPEIICIAGDTLNHMPPGSQDLPAQHILPFVKECVSLAPTFLSLGNHEWMFCQEDLMLLRSNGVHVLDNQWEPWKDVYIGGLTSAEVTGTDRSIFRGEVSYSRPPRMREPLEPSVSWLGEFCSQPGYKILLCHHPEYYPRYLKDLDLDLVLSGHAHGGQWRFFDRGVFAPGQGLFPKLTSGVQGPLVISRGLANTAPVPRFFNPREVVYLLP